MQPSTLLQLLHLEGNARPLQYSTAKIHISYYLINYINKVIRCLRFGLFRVAVNARGWICAECLLMFIIHRL